MILACADNFFRIIPALNTMQEICLTSVMNSNDFEPGWNFKVR